MRLPSPTMLDAERYFSAAGYTALAGVDEVGRGALAGPLVAAAVILPACEVCDLAEEPWRSIRDSKVLSARTRERLSLAIQASARCTAIGAVPNEELDMIGVSAANRLAMERAIEGLSIQPDWLLLDATTVDSGLPQTGLIDGDALSLSVAAASIVAKVWRDQVMTQAHDTWPAYGFARNKGYGAAMHMQALREIGPCPIHRTCYAPVRAAMEGPHGVS